MSAAITLPLEEDTLWKVLPRSATSLERDILKLANTDNLREAAIGLTDIKYILEPTDFIPLLLMEYGFAEAAKRFLDYPTLLEAAKRLRGKFGTPCAILEMAKIMGYTNATLWEEPEPTIHFPEFQLNLGQYEWRLDRLATLRHLINVVKPVRGRLRRVFYGWDDRQTKWDESFWGNYWDTYSGIDILPLVSDRLTYRIDDLYIVSMGLYQNDITQLPLLESALDTEATVEESLLIEAYVDMLYSESYDVRLDQGYFDFQIDIFPDGSIIPAPDYGVCVGGLYITVAGIVITCPIPEV